jgi:hypothetical protein
MKFRMKWLMERSATLVYLVNGLSEMYRRKRDGMTEQDRVAMKNEIDDYKQELHRRDIETMAMIQNPELQY